MNRFLFVTTENPFPPDSGGRLRAKGFLDILSMHATVDVVTYKRSKSQDPSNDKINLIEVARTTTTRQTAIRGLLRGRNGGYMSHAEIDMQAPLKHLLTRYSYDFVFLDNTMLGHLIPFIKRTRSDLAIVTISHNFETSICYQLAMSQTSVIKKARFLLDSLFTRRDECKVCDTTDLLLTTSQNESDAFARLSPKAASKSTVVPNFIRAESYQQDAEASVTPDTIIFPGDMSYFPNVNGFVYFYEQVYSLLKKAIPDIRWFVVGKNCHEKIINLAKADDSIVITGYVPSVSAYVARCGAVIVPLLEGSGTRLKIVEAWAVGRPVISTSIGCEGLECENDVDIVVADTPAAFVEGIVKLLRNEDFSQRIARNARRRLMTHYDIGANQPKLLQVLESYAANHPKNRDLEHAQ